MFSKYYDAGLHTIPIKRKSKHALGTLGQSLIDWSTNGIPENLIEKWDKEFPLSRGFGIAILCGKSSNIIGLDIDTDNEEVLALCPQSPCVKRGAKGETRFFRYNNELAASRKIGQIDLLSNGKYCILPPSLHPDTGVSYQWTGEDELFYTMQSLPTLNSSMLLALEDHYNGNNETNESKGTKADSASVSLSGVYNSDGARCAHGAHDRLKKLAAILAGKDTPFEQAVEELIRYDNEHHTGQGYFEDKSRGADGAADPFSNATRFYANILHTINRGRIRRGEEPHKGITGAFSKDMDGNENNDATPVEARPLIFKPYPKARGLMGQFQEYCQLTAKGNQDALGLGGAIALFSVLSANRFRTQIGHFDVRPNLYVINLARSGSGKETPQNLISRLLEDTDLVTASGFKSATSILQQFPDRQELITIIDECSALLKSISQGELYQQEINDILSLLFSKSNSRYDGMASVGHGANFGAVYNPSFTIFGSTTPHGFTQSVDRSMGAKGLMPRFLVFYQQMIGDYKPFDQESAMQSKQLFKELKKGIEAILAIDKAIERPAQSFDLRGGDAKGMGHKYRPIFIPSTPEVLELYQAFARENHPDDNKDESFEDAFKNRLAELAMKIALIDAVSLGKNEVDADSFDWAVDVVKAQWSNSKDLYEQTNAENRFEHDTHRLLVAMRRFSSDEISGTALCKKTQHLKPRERDEILKNLADQGLIEVFYQGRQKRIRKLDGFKMLTEI